MIAAHRDHVTGPIRRFFCAACWRIIDIDHPPGYSGPSGYAVTPSGGLICYPCADLSERESLRDRSRPFFAYLSSDGRSVTTWTGGILGSVSCLSVSRNGFHRSEVARFRARDVHGQWWAGAGPGRGMYVRMRPMKTPRGG